MFCCGSLVCRCFGEPGRLHIQDEVRKQWHSADNYSFGPQDSWEFLAPIAARRIQPRSEAWFLNVTDEPFLLF